MSTIVDEASAIADLSVGFLNQSCGLERVVFANKLRRVIDEQSPLKAAEAKPQPVEPMEYREACHMARERIEYGQYSGQCYGDIPRSYLDWLVEAKRTEWRRLASFLRSPVAPGVEVEDDE